jgi:hypothetical protein
MKRIALSALALGVAAYPARAQGVTANTNGFMVNVHGQVAPAFTVKGDDINGEIAGKLGGGGGIQLGYGFSPRFMLVGNLDLAKQGSDVDGLDGSLALAHVELGARMHFAMANRPYVPYVTALIGSRAFGAEVETAGGEKQDMSLSGGVFSVGGGLQYFLSPKLAFDGSLLFGFGKMGKFEVDGDDEDIDVDNSLSTRLKFGLSWYPGSR